MLTPGARLGPYEIQTHIGSGGMGEVYRATDTNLKRAVAIKVLPASVAPSQHRADLRVGEIRRHPRADGRYVAFVAMTQNVRSLWLGF